MKKRISILLAAVLVFALAACGGNHEAAAPREQAVSTPAQSGSTSPAEQANTAEPEQTAGIRPQIKEAIDSYEAFVDEYCEFMQTYDVSDLSALSAYGELVTKELEMSREFSALEEEDLTDEEALYYSQVSFRCAEKLLDVAANMN